MRKERRVTEERLVRFQVTDALTERVQKVLLCDRRVGRLELGQHEPWRGASLWLTVPVSFGHSLFVLETKEMNLILGALFDGKLILELWKKSKPGRMVHVELHMEGDEAVFDSCGRAPLPTPVKRELARRKMQNDRVFWFEWKNSPPDVYAIDVFGCLSAKVDRKCHRELRKADVPATAGESDRMGPSAFYARTLDYQLAWMNHRLGKADRLADRLKEFVQPLGQYRLERIEGKEIVYTTLQGAPSLSGIKVEAYRAGSEGGSCAPSSPAAWAFRKEGLFVLMGDDDVARQLVKTAVEAIGHDFETPVNWSSPDKPSS
jgi:hypothetical protein